MKYFCFLLIIALICVWFTDAASRVRREEDTLEQLQKKLAEGFDSVRKAAEEMAAKVDFKQIQQDLANQFDGIAKALSDLTTTAEKKEENV